MSKLTLSIVSFGKQSHEPIRRIRIHHPRLFRCGYYCASTFSRDVCSSYGGLSMNEWQPIETVPRDGTIVDLWMQSRIWLADGGSKVGVEQRVPDAIFFDGEWRNTDGNVHDYLEGFTNIEFTHWRLSKGPSETSWRPIETAPKISTGVIGYFPANKCSMDMFWCATHDRWESFSALGHHSFSHEPTHWMPLPAPPKASP